MQNFFSLLFNAHLCVSKAFYIGNKNIIKKYPEFFNVSVLSS